MQVSLETLSGLERRMTIEVPAEQVESKVQKRLQEAAKTVDMKGFRKGKVPLKVIKNRFGPGVRQEVVGELMSQSYYEAVNQQKINPAGQPKIEAKSLEEGKNLEFTATFEVFPELKVADFSAIEVEKQVAEIKKADIDTMIETLRTQRQEFKEIGRKSKKGDQLNIDFTGTIDGETFAGGEGKGSDLVLGSNRMIAGFEDGLIGAKKGDERVLSLTFPEDYHSKDIAGKAVEFTIQVNSASEVVLPELNDEFFAAFDIKDGGEGAFRTEVSGNMERELKNMSKSNLKTQVLEGLLGANKVDVPKALRDSEINVLRQQTMQQFGGGAKIDESMLPAEMFEAEAEKRVAISLVLNEIIRTNELKAEPKAVRTMLEDMAQSYEDPEEVVNWYYANKEQLANVESMVLEETVIELILNGAKVKEVKASYEEALKPYQGKPVDSEKAEAKPKAKAKAKTKAEPKAKAKAKPKAKAKKDSTDSSK